MLQNYVPGCCYILTEIFILYNLLYTIYMYVWKGNIKQVRTCKVNKFGNACRTSLIVSPSNWKHCVYNVNFYFQLHVHGQFTWDIFFFFGGGTVILHWCVQCYVLFQLMSCNKISWNCRVYFFPSAHEF